MNNATLTQATLMALTMQNMAHKAGPLSTALMQGQVINRNIKQGETVCCYYNGLGDLLRIGDVPVHGGDFFVDNENRMYDLSGGKIRIRDGLSGYVYDDESVDAYDFKVISGGTCCAYKVSENEQLWRFFFEDGTSCDIEYPRFANYFPKIGYRNGLIGIGVGLAINLNGVYIYDKSGQLLSRLVDINTPTSLSETEIYAVLPNSPTGALVITQVILIGGSGYGAWAVTTSTSARITLFEGYSVRGQTTEYLGADQSYAYFKVQMYDSEQQYTIDEWLVWKVSIDDYTSELHEHYYGTEPVFYNPISSMGSVAANLDGTTKLYDMSSMEQLYASVLTSVPNTSIIRENEAFLWINGKGVYQKTISDWLMYPTSVYPRSEPYGKLGYAIESQNIGKIGTAVVLFE